jgi:1-acyl-sn-glycerol-3-phosphate acyltransferase
MRTRILHWFFNFLVRTLSKTRSEGLENVPISGPYLMVSNHLSMADLPVTYIYLGGPHITGWVAEKWRYHPLFTPILRLGGGIFIERGEVDRTALDAAVRWLRSGKAFGMSPEGTRSRNGSLQRGKTGAAYLAAAADVPVLPVGIIGTDQTFQTLSRLRRPELVVRVGEPFQLPPLEANGRSASLRRNTDEIMCRIAALLPPRYWGHYRDHPRLRQLVPEHVIPSDLTDIASV